MIDVLYTPEQVSFPNSYSPSASKPPLVVGDWLKDFKDKLQVVPFYPVTSDQLKKVHDADYVDGILDCTISNGFGGTDPDVAQSLLYTSGSFLAAAKTALDKGIAASPTSGFHHACYMRGGGFCTFNGLMVAAAELFDTVEGVGKIGIVDCDMHYGDGTDNIIKTLKLQAYIDHFTLGEDFSYPNQAKDFFRVLKYRLDLMTKTCDIIFYQAGADPHIDDPLGGFLNTEQLRYRDMMVFDTCSKSGTPLVWNLAGGYQKPIQNVLEIHNNTMRECIRYYG